MKKLIIALILVSTFLFQAVKAQTNTSSPDTATMNFVTQATIGGLKEIKTGELAQRKGSSNAVKSFGARMITDHSKANNMLMQIVKPKGIQISLPDTTTLQTDPMLTQSSGKDFDKSYVNMMVADHEKTVALFERAASSLTDPQIKAFAAQQLPTLKQHLATIKQINSQINGSK
jgi:putative membrane protein